MVRDDKITVLAVNKRSWKSPQPGGAEVNLENCLARLAERGHEVHVLAGGNTRSRYTEAENNLTIHSHNTFGRGGSSFGLLYTYLLLTILSPYYIYRISPDVVYTVNTPLPWPIVTSRPRVAIYHHVAIDSIFESHSFPQNLVGYLAQRLGIYWDQDRPTVSVSPSTTRELLQRGHSPESVYEIRNGINIDDYTPGTEDEDPKVVYVGGLQKYKGVDRLPDIHQAICERCGKDVKLDVAGRSGEVQGIIQDYCNREEKAEFHGYVSEERKIELLQKAWVFLAPSRVEGWGLVIIEANACKTPAVGSDVSGLRDSIRDGETGILSKGEKTDVFSADVVRLLSDDNLRDEIGNNARKWAEEHSWDKTALELENLFKKLKG